MIRTQDLEKIIALTLYTSYIEGEKPASLMVISDRPEAGKTEMVMKYRGNDGIRIVSDLTAYSLWRDLGNEIKSGEIKHIIIPEFIAPLSRRSETVSSLIAALQMLIEDGILEIHTGFLKEAIKMEAPTAVGAIVCMPLGTFDTHKLEWQVSGFLSRFMVASYKYDKTTVDDIFESIITHEYREVGTIPLNFPSEKQHIILPDDIAREALEVVKEQTAEARRTGKAYGFREMKNFLRLLSAHVIMTNAMYGDERDTINRDDYNEVLRLSYLLNTNCNEIGG